MIKAKITNDLFVGDGCPFTLIGGPCVIESEDMILKLAEKISEITQRLNIQYIFKASFDKANRTSLDSYRGPGLDKGLEILQKVKDNFKLPLLTDIHEPVQAKTAAQVVDVLQIPAFLCRQTDILLAAAKTGKAVNVKKGQFLAAHDMKHVVKKLEQGGAKNIMLTERGSTFGYNNLVVDFRSLPQMRLLGYPVVFDGTHSVQLPGGMGGSSGGQRQFIPTLVSAAAAVGMDALFLEIHEDPDKALSDGPNMIKLKNLDELLKSTLDIWERAKV